VLSLSALILSAVALIQAKKGNSIFLELLSCTDLTNLRAFVDRLDNSYTKLPQTDLWLEHFSEEVQLFQENKCFLRE